jgi:cell division protein FtsA
MPEIAERVLNLPVRCGQPAGIGGLRDFVGNPKFSTGVGLILHAIRSEKDGVGENKGEAKGGWFQKGLKRLSDMAASFF